jgi:hypothetical protein
MQRPKNSNAAELHRTEASALVNMKQNLEAGSPFSVYPDAA